MQWQDIEKTIKSILNNNFYIIITLLIILLSSWISPVSTKIAFENLGEILPKFISNYFKNISLNNEQILSIFQLLSTLNILSFLILLLSIWKMNYYKETNALFSFFLSINTYFVLLISILNQLNITAFDFGLDAFIEHSGFFKSLFSMFSFTIVWTYIILIILGFIIHKDYKD